MSQAPSGENIDDFYQGYAEEGIVNYYKETIEQFVSITETLKKRSTMALQDDKAAWFSSGQKRIGGKVLLLDPSDYGTQHIFFDDMANE